LHDYIYRAAYDVLLKYASTEIAEIVTRAATEYSVSYDVRAALHPVTANIFAQTDKMATEIANRAAEESSVSPDVLAVSASYDLRAVLHPQIYRGAYDVLLKYVSTEIVTRAAEESSVSPSLRGAFHEAIYKQVYGYLQQLSPEGHNAHVLVVDQNTKTRLPIGRVLFCLVVLLLFLLLLWWFAFFR
jgi:hypothetical protein